MARSNAAIGVIVALVVSALAGCTFPQAYTTGQSWQLNQCNRIPDRMERQRCVDNASASYEDYKRFTERMQ